MFAHINARIILNKTNDKPPSFPKFGKDGGFYSKTVCICRGDCKKYTVSSSCLVKKFQPCKANFFTQFLPLKSRKIKVFNIMNRVLNIFNVENKLCIKVCLRLHMRTKYGKNLHFFARNPAKMILFDAYHPSTCPRSSAPRSFFRSAG